MIILLKKHWKGAVKFGLIFAAALSLLAVLPVAADEVTGTITTGVGSGSGINGTVIAAPTANPAAGTYTSAQTVALSASGSSSIVYSTNGSTVPNCTGTGTTYTSAISVTTSTTIQAISCYTNSQASAVVPFIYTLSCPQ